jgi:hypothetical protein
MLGLYLPILLSRFDNDLLLEEALKNISRKADIRRELTISVVTKSNMISLIAEGDGKKWIVTSAPEIGKSPSHVSPFTVEQKRWYTALVFLRKRKLLTFPNRVKMVADGAHYLVGVSAQRTRGRYRIVEFNRDGSVQGIVPMF